MSAHYTKPGLPELPEPDGDVEITVIGRSVFVDAFRASTLKDYGRQCYDAGRADHVAEVGPMVALTHEQVMEIAQRFASLKRMDLIFSVIRATENAHGIASPKEAA